MTAQDLQNLEPEKAQGLFAALKEAQDTVRSYDTKAQIVGVGEGAAYGAGIGAAGGGLRNRRQTQQAEAAAATQADNLAEQTRLSLSSFGKAYKTCLEGRGYAIS